MVANYFTEVRKCIMASLVEVTSVWVMAYGLLIELWNVINLITWVFFFFFFFFGGGGGGGGDGELFVNVCVHVHECTELQSYTILLPIILLPISMMHNCCPYLSQYSRKMVMWQVFVEIPTHYFPNTISTWPFMVIFTRNIFIYIYILN